MMHIVWQYKVFTKLLGLQYKIVYKKGVDNQVADALSRRTHDQEELCMVSSPTTAWLQSVQDSYSSDPAAKEILSKLAVNKDLVPNYQLNQGVIKYKSRIWVGNDEALKHQLITTFHDSAIGGTLGFLSPIED
jgi:hypothetical protein